MAKVNRDFCRPILNGRAVEFAPVVISPSPVTPTEEEYNAAGWFRNAIIPPSPPAGKMVASTTYSIVGNEVVAEYSYEDIPKPVRTFSKLRIVSALMSQGVWEQVKQYIEEAGLYDLFLAAQDFSDDNEFFQQGRETLQQALGWTDEQVEDVLKAAEI